MDYIFETILFNAKKCNATDIHLISKNDGLEVSFRSKGNLILFTYYSNLQGNQLLNYIKFLSNIDLNYRLSYQTGAFEYQLKNKLLSLRVSLIPTRQGDNLVIRILNQKKFTSLESLTKHKEAIEFLKTLSNCQSGLVLMSGPTGVGKSTTLHSLLNEVYRKKQLNIITIEDPIEIEEPDFIQIQLNFNEQFSVEQALKQILRHDPDVVMIGEIRDEISANIAIRLALTGCLVFATIHAKNCIGTLKRLFNLQLNRIDIQEVLYAVISQRLIFKKSMAIYEWIDYQQLKQYYKDEYISYHTFKHNTELLITRGILDAEDLRGYSFEK